MIVEIYIMRYKYVQIYRDCAKHIYSNLGKNLKYMQRHLEIQIWFHKSTRGKKYSLKVHEMSSQFDTS